MQFVDGWVDTAKEYNLMQNSMSRSGLPLTHLVIHGTAGGSDGGSIAAYMGGAGVSTHFVISTDGTVWQLVSLEVAAWANAPLNAPRLNFKYAGYNPNFWTASIEFAKPDTTNGINITDAQKASGFPLIKLICETYNIPKKRGDGNSGIISHADINSIDRSRCPGTFPWDELIAYLNGNSSTQGDDMAIDINSPGVKNYFKEVDSSHWQCKNGKVVAFGILGFYKRNNGLQLLGLPLSGEMYPKQGVSVQQFERGFVAYDPQKQIDNPPGSGDCYMMHIDQGPAFDVLFTAATAPLLDQIKQLQAAVKVDPAQYQALQTQLTSFKQVAQTVVNTVQPLLK
jgi:hypothetical protein